jgi:hypothetical protein
MIESIDTTRMERQFAKTRPATFDILAERRASNTPGACWDTRTSRRRSATCTLTIGNWQRRRIWSNRRVSNSQRDTPVGAGQQAIATERDGDVSGNQRLISLPAVSPMAHTIPTPIANSAGVILLKSQTGQTHTLRRGSTRITAAISNSSTTVAQNATPGFLRSVMGIQIAGG